MVFEKLGAYLNQIVRRKIFLLLKKKAFQKKSIPELKTVEIQQRARATGNLLSCYMKNALAFRPLQVRNFFMHNISNVIYSCCETDERGIWSFLN